MTWCELVSTYWSNWYPFFCAAKAAVGMHKDTAGLLNIHKILSQRVVRKETEWIESNLESRVGFSHKSLLMLGFFRWISLGWGLHKSSRQESIIGVHIKVHNWHGFRDRLEETVRSKRTKHGGPIRIGYFISDDLYYDLAKTLKRIAWSREI